MRAAVTGGLVGVWVIGVVGLNPGASSAQNQEGWRSSSSVAVTTGDYGTGDDTTITQLSQAFRYRMPRGEVGVSVPYLFREGSGATPGESRRARNRPIPTEADGLGDLQLIGKYDWLAETEARPGVDLAGRLKLPTASEEKGLGTGGVDVGVGPELTKRLGRWIAMGNLELVVRDTPSDSTLKSTRLDYAAGLGYAVTDRLTASMSLEGGTKSSADADAPLELVWAAAYRATTTLSLNGFALAGLSDGSPDVGLGAGATLTF